MRYEWDEAKRQNTLVKRGLDFAIIVDLDWQSAFTKQDTRRDYSEPRYVTIGTITQRLYVVAWCYRDETIRIISLRKANKREVRFYEQTSPLP